MAASAIKLHAADSGNIIGRSLGGERRRGGNCVARRFVQETVGG